MVSSGCPRTLMRIGVVLAVVLGLGVPSEGAAEQESANAPGQGPLVLLDRAHNNFFVYRPENRNALVDLLEGDGYQVRELDGPFDRESLAGVQIVVVAMALSAQNVYHSPAEIPQAWRMPTPSAFSEDEIAVLSEWVEAGGSLLLVFEHMPLAGAAQDLAGAFGIEISNGFVVDGTSLADLDLEITPQTDLGDWRATFTRVDGTLVAHPVTNGRQPSEQVDAVATFGGSAFRLPPGGEPLFTLAPAFVSLLAEVAWQFSDTTPHEPVGGWAQGGVLRAGQGRVAVFSDAFILYLVGGVGSEPDAPQLLRNVLHWLSGLPAE